MPVRDGTFYFILTTNGNLIDEYTNEHIDHFRVEASNRTPPGVATEQGPDRGFAGHYNTIWIDQDCERAHLEICETAPKQFTLVWTENGRRLFEGEGTVTPCGRIEGKYRSAVGA